MKSLNTFSVFSDVCLSTTLLLLATVVCCVCPQCQAPESSVLKREFSLNDTQTNIDIRISISPGGDWGDLLRADVLPVQHKRDDVTASLLDLLHRSTKDNQTSSILNHSDHQYLGPLLGADPVPGGKAVLLCKLIDLRIVHLHIAGSSYLAIKDGHWLCSPP